MVFEALNDKGVFLNKMYLTKVTDLFEEDSPDYRESEIYNLLKSKNWNLVKSTIGYETQFDRKLDGYNLHEDVLIVKNGKLHQQSLTFSMDSTNVFKFTDKGIYVRNGDKLVISLKAELRKGAHYDEIIMLGYPGGVPVELIFREVDPKGLVYYDDLPKNIRLKCLESVVRFSLENFLKEENEFNDFYFDLGTIEFIRSVDEECIYHYAVTQRSPHYYDVYTKMRVKVEVREDGLIYFNFY